MTDFEKLMDLLEIPNEQRGEFFVDLVNNNVELVLQFNRDGSINWGTL